LQVASKNIVIADVNLAKRMRLTNLSQFHSLISQLSLQKTIPKSESLGNAINAAKSIYPADSIKTLPWKNPHGPPPWLQ